MKVIRQAQTRDILDAYDREDISYSRMNEMFNVLAEQFAIGFTEFSINYNYHPMHKVWIRYDKMANEKFTTKELLEIYKKESNL
jgi:hypothetical protein